MKRHSLLAALCGTVFCLLAMATTALAQPGGGGPIPGGGGPGPTPVPIDGGASLLLAAGAAYGLKKLRARRVKA